MNIPKNVREITINNITMKVALIKKNYQEFFRFFDINNNQKIDVNKYGTVYINNISTRGQLSINDNIILFNLIDKEYYKN